VPPSAAQQQHPAEIAGVPVLPWSQFLARMADAGDAHRPPDPLYWSQGEHVSLIGPTGTGKSTLAEQLYPLRRAVCVLGTKPADRTLDRLKRGRRGVFGIGRESGSGAYLRVHDYDDVPAYEHRILLWPPFRGPQDVARQRAAFAHAIPTMFAEGGWTIAADEAYYLCKVLGLPHLLEMVWTQGRSNNVTLIAATQRPRFVPLFMYDQATHLFFWRDNDEENRRRIGGIGGMDSRRIRAIVGQLPKHACLYVNARTDALAVTRAGRG